MDEKGGMTFGIILVIVILLLLFLVFLESQGIRSLSYVMGG